MQRGCSQVNKFCYPVITKINYLHLCVKMKRQKRIYCKNKEIQTVRSGRARAASLSEDRTAAEGHSPNNWAQMTPVPLALSANDRLIVPRTRARPKFNFQLMQIRRHSLYTLRPSRTTSDIQRFTSGSKWPGSIRRRHSLKMHSTAFRLNC